MRTISSAKTLGPLEPRRRDGQPGLGVDLTDRVEPVRDVLLGRDVPAALLGDDVHDDRTAERLRVAQRPLDRTHVVPVDRADVLDAEVLEHALRRQDVLDALLHPVQRVVRRATGCAGPAQRALAPGQDVLVAPRRAQGVEVVREAADGRRVGAAVVVDDDDEPAVLPGGDVVERLPGHAARQGAVADHRDDVPVAAALQLVGLGDAVGPAERGGGVRVLDDVVLGLRPAGVPGQAALAAQLREVVAAGQQLVHVRLVARVEHHGVQRRLEHPVHRDGQLDDAEVGSEVTAGAGDLLDQERRGSRRRGRRPGAR